MQPNENSQETTDSKLAHPLSPVWIIVYLVLHMFVLQCVRGPYVFVQLRVGFLVAVAAYLSCSGAYRQIIPALFGRVVPRLSTCLIYATAVLAGRYVGAIVFPMNPISDSLPHYFGTNVLLPAINEEVVFRSLFLGILVFRCGLSKWGAILLASLMFTCCHDLTSASIPRLFFLTALGAVCGAAFFSKHGGLVAAIVSHAAWNMAPLLYAPTGE